MWKLLAILNIFGILGLGAHDLLSHQAFSQASKAVHCSACDSCHGEDPGDAASDGEDDRSCSTLCDCGCFHLSALGSVITGLPVNMELVHHFSNPDYHYDFDLNLSLFEPPRIA